MAATGDTQATPADGTARANGVTQAEVAAQAAGATRTGGAAPAGERDGEAPLASRWPGWVGTVLALAGVGVSAYLTYAHYTTATSLACPESGLVNCVKVTTSQYSHFLGLPVAVLGLAYFVAMLPVQLPLAWRIPWMPLRAARLGASVVGVIMILWLLYAELFRLNAICLYCTAVHVLTFLLFISTALGTVATAPLRDVDE